MIDKEKPIIVVGIDQSESIQVVAQLNNLQVGIKELQNNVWGYSSDLETHTVETHIYRLRKKMKEKFTDDEFIRNTKKGYKIL